MKKMIKFIIRDLDSLREDFLKVYDPDYWIYKIVLLKNTYDYFDEIKGKLWDEFDQDNEKDFKKMLKTELHFLYFQMIETLFELIFAIIKHDNRDLWVALSFTKRAKTAFQKDTYDLIKKFSNNTLKNLNSSKKIQIEIKSKKIEIPILRWIFYFSYDFKVSNEEWEKNLNIIKSLLKSFSHDFTDRGEYNAYKHSLRFCNTPFSLAIKLKSKKDWISIGKSSDAISYLEEGKEVKSTEKNTIVKEINIVTKPFDFERDFRFCLNIYRLIFNIINSRKYAILKDFQGKKLDLYSFTEIKIPEDLLPKTKTTRFSINA